MQVAVVANPASDALAVVSIVFVHTNCTILTRAVEALVDVIAIVSSKAARAYAQVVVSGHG
jgi:hypothetical protein